MEPLELVGAIALDIAITIPSKAGKNGTLKVIKEIHHRFFGFGIFLFGGNLHNGRPSNSITGKRPTTNKQRNSFEGKPQKRHPFAKRKKKMGKKK